MAEDGYFFLAEGHQLKFGIESVAIPFHVRFHQLLDHSQSICHPAALPIIPPNIQGASEIKVIKLLD